MRYLFLLLVLANVAVFAFGQGLFGLPPSDAGREPRPLAQRNQHLVELSPPAPTRVVRDSR